MTARFVLVHGLRTSHSMWRPQTDALRTAGVPTVSVDLPGHGERIDDEFTADAAVGAIREGVAAARAVATQPGPVILVGLSLGGFFSLETVGRDPSLVDGLIAMGCTTRPFRVAIEMYRRGSRAMMRLPDRGEALDAAGVRLALGRAAAIDVLAGGHGIAQSEAAVNAVAQLTPLESVTRAAARGLAVWYVNGQFDQFRLEERRFLADTPGALLTVVPHASHMVNLSRPGAVNHLLLAAAASLMN